MRLIGAEIVQGVEVNDEAQVLGSIRRHHVEPGFEMTDDRDPGWQPLEQGLAVREVS